MNFFPKKSIKNIINRHLNIIYLSNYHSSTFYISSFQDLESSKVEKSFQAKSRTRENSRYAGQVGSRECRRLRSWDL